MRRAIDSCSLDLVPLIVHDRVCRLLEAVREALQKQELDLLRTSLENAPRSRSCACSSCDVGQSSRGREAFQLWKSAGRCFLSRCRVRLVRACVRLARSVSSGQRADWRVGARTVRAPGRLARFASRRWLAGLWWALVGPRPRGWLRRMVCFGNFRWHASAREIRESVAVVCARNR